VKTSENPVIVEQSFDLPSETVWKAITELDQMHKWYFENIPSFKAEVGFETQFDIQNEDRHFLHMWKVIEVVNLKMIKYNWRYANWPGDSFVTFELSDENEQTKLRVTAQVLEDFPDDVPEFSRTSCMAGWTYFIRQRLPQFLSKNNKNNRSTF